MDFGEAIQIVSDLTHRPDKITEIQLGINQAIKFFSSHSFDQDLEEIANFVIDGTLYTQSFDITGASFTRFKKIKYLRPSGYKKYLTHRDSSRMFHNNIECLDTWYRSGNNIIFKLSNLQSELKIGYYKYHASLVNNADTDWMLDELDTAVLDFASARIFGAIGDDTERKRYFDNAMLVWAAAKGDLLDSSAHA